MVVTKQPRLTREEGGRQNVILAHVDCRLENFFLSQGGRCVVIDFQAMQARQPCTDVAYFLGQSLSVDTRREHEVELLRFWYRLMTEVHGVDAREFSWEECVQDYHISAVYSALIPYFWVKTAQSQMKTMSQAEQQRTLSTLDQVVQRSCTFVTDCNGLALARLMIGWIKEAEQKSLQLDVLVQPDVDALVQRSQQYLQPKFFR